MNVHVEPGKYVVAVSGGVDSAVLLNVLSNLPEMELIVAHFDHGIRNDSAEDAEFVRQLAKKYDLPFELGRGNLGPSASEAKARAARYEFLHNVRKKHYAKAIITAHHKDDVLETALINVLRGTGRKGLTSLKSTNDIIRPLLGYTKNQIIDYAITHQLRWREDPTNIEDTYTRNKIRNLLKQSDNKIQDKLHELIKKSGPLNEEADSLLDEILDVSSTTIDRLFFIDLPYEVSAEVLAHWLRKHGCEFDRKDIARLVRAMKVAAVGTQHNVDKKHNLVIGKKQISLQSSSSV